MFRRVLFVFVVFCLPSFAQAQVTHSQEVEIGSDGMGHSFVSVFLFFDTSNLNARVRPFWVNGAMSRVEVGLGPTAKFGPVTVKWTFGGTTNEELMTVGVLITKIHDHKIVSVNDAKFAVGSTTSSLYQKVWLSVDAKSIWQIRYEHLFVGKNLIFVRPGVEYQFQFPTQISSHIYIAPFYDPRAKHVGGQVGFRFFDLRLR